MDIRDQSARKKLSQKLPLEKAKQIQRNPQLKSNQSFDYDVEELEEQLPRYEPYPTDKVQQSALYSSLIVFNDVLNELSINLNITNSKVDTLIYQVGLYQEPINVSSGGEKAAYEKELNLNDLITKLANLTKFSANINSDFTKIV